MSQQQKEPTQTLQTRVWLACFRTLHDIAQDANISIFFVVLLWFLDLANLLLLPLGPSHALPWEQSPAMHGLWQFLQFLWFVPGAGEHFPAVPYNWTALYGALVAWMCLALTCFGWLTYVNLGLSDYYPRWMLVALRISARVAIHGLWGTIIMNLVDPFVCEREPGATWRISGLTCWTGAHLVLVIFTALLLPLVLLYHCLIALTYIDREPDYSGKKNLLSAAHGRVDAIMLVLKTAMCIFYVFGEETIASYAFLFPVLAAGLYWMFLYIRYQPYQRSYLNGMQTALAALYTSACCYGLLAFGIGNMGGPQSGAVAFLFGSPIILFAGWALHSFHQKQYVSGTAVRGTGPLELTTPFTLELRGRALLNQAALNGVDPRLTAVNKAGDDYYTSTQTQHGGKSGLESARQQADHRGMNADDAKETVRLLTSQNHAAQHANLAAEAKEVRDQVAQLYQEGSKIFGNSPMLYLFWANFQTTITKNHHLERLMLRQAVDKADWSAVDVHFFAWSRELTLEMQADAAGATKMNVERRMRYEKLNIESRLAVSRVRDQVLLFWEELMTKSPDLLRLQAVGAVITEGLKQADAIFQQLLQLAPQNASIIRSYAEFLLELANDPRKAQDLLADAEQMEDDASKAHASLNRREHGFALAIQDLDLSADSVGTAQVSSSQGTVGTILACNLSLCRLVGYSQRELVGRPLTDLVPEPIGQVHDVIVDQFLQVGETRFLGVSRLTFLLHRGGYMVPARVFVQPTGQDFHAVVDSAATPPGEAYLWCLGAEGGWTITAMCELAMNSLGLDPTDMKAGSITMPMIVKDVAAVVDGIAAQGATTAVFSRLKGRPGGSLSSAATSTPYKVKGQVIYIPAVGTPIHMLRLKAVTQHYTEQHDVQRAAVKDAVGCADSVDESLDRASSGSSTDGRHGGEEGAGESSAVDQPDPGARDPYHTQFLRGRRPSFKTSLQQEEQGDISLCPVMGKSSHGLPDPHARPGSGRPTPLPIVRTEPDSELIEGWTASESVNLPGTTGADVEPVIAARSDAESSEASRFVSTADPILSSLSAEEEKASPSAGTPGGAKKRLVLMLPAGHKDSFTSEEILPDAAAAPPRSQSPRVMAPVPAAKHAATMPASHQRDGVVPRLPISALKTSTLSPVLSGKVEGQSKAVEETYPRLDAKGAPAAPGSVHSKGSASSTGSLSDALRRGVLARSGRLETSLRTLNVAVIITFVLTAALNLAGLIVTQIFMGQMGENVVLVEHNGHRAIYAQRLYANVQAYRAAAVGLADPVDMEYARARNDAYLQAFTMYNRQLYLAVDGSLADETDLYTNSSAVALHEARNATASPTSLDDVPFIVRRTNLANAASEMATRMRAVLALNASNILLSEQSGNVYWLIVNGPSALRYAMNASLMFADQRSASHGQRIKQADLIILIVSETVFLLVIFLAILPATSRVSRAKHAVFDTFIEVPLPVIRALRTTVQKRIALAAEDEEMGTAVDVGEDQYAEDDTDIKATLKIGVSSDDSSDRGLSDGLSSSKGDLMAAVNASANTGGAKSPRAKAKARHYKHAGASMLSTLALFIWPVVAYMIYFVIIWWYKGTVVDGAVADRAQLLWSVQVELYVRMASIRLQISYQFCDAAYVNRQLDSAESNLAFTERLVDGLLYGSVERNLPAGLQEPGSESLSNLWLVNGCSQDEDWFYDPAACLTFSNGLLTRGLLGAFTSYADTARKLIEQRRAAVAGGGCVLEHIAEAGTYKELLSVLGTKYLAGGFDRSTHAFFEAASNNLLSFTATYRAIVGGTVAALGVIYLTMYLPQIKRLDREIKNVRLLLLLFPDEVSKAVPCIVAASRHLLQGSSSVSAGSSSSTTRRRKRTLESVFKVEALAVYNWSRRADATGTRGLVQELCMRGSSPCAGGTAGAEVVRFKMWSRRVDYRLRSKRNQ